MKRNSKKLLAMLLAVVLVISQIPVLASAVEEVDPMILHQPTFGEPYVEVLGEAAAYQWYYSEMKYVPYDMVGEVTEDDQVLGNATCGTWDAENGVWKSAVWDPESVDQGHYLTFHFEAELDARIFFPGFFGHVEDVFMTAKDIYSDENGTWVYICSSEESALVLSVEPTAENEFGAFSTSAVFYNLEQVDVAAEGQNKATFQLTEPDYRNLYCAVTFEDGTVLKSDSFDLGYYCYNYPNASNPTALFTWDKYITGYQWYYLETKEHTWAIDFGDNYGRYLRWGTGYWFNDEIGQYVAQTLNGTTYSPNAQLYLQKGDIVTFAMSDSYDGTATFNVYGDGGIAPYTATLENGAYIYTASENCELDFIFEDDAEFTYTITIKGIVDIYTPLEGETSNTLKSTKLGQYLCDATYKVEEDQFASSVHFELHLDFDKQPTEDAPTVTVNLPDQVKGYQWYTNETQNKTAFVTPNYIETGYPAYHWDCRFDQQTNEFYPYEGLTYIYTSFQVREGSSVKITITSDDFEGVVTINDEPLTGENGVYSYQFEYDTYCSVRIESDATIRATVQYTGDIDVAVPVEGQTTATLKAPKAGQYWCVVTDVNDREIESDSVNYDYEFTTEPTEEKPTASVTFSELVKSYQWYIKETKEYTGPITKEIADDMDFMGELQEDGSIKSTSFDAFENAVFISTGDAQIKMDIPAGATVVGMYERLEDGTFVADSLFRSLALIIYAEDSFTVNPQITYSTTEYVKVEGQTTATLTGDPTGTYYCEVEYQDGETIRSKYVHYGYSIEEEPTVDEPTIVVTSPEQVKSYQWYYSNMAKKSDTLKPEHVYKSYNLYKDSGWASIEGDGQIGIVWQLMCQPGDKLTLNLPEGMEFDVTVDGGTYENGIVTADSSYLDIVILSDAAFTLAPKWDYMAHSVDAVADQTTDTLTPSAPGYYYCVVTYQDGTELESRYLDYYQKIKVEPTDNAPIVEMMWPELVEKYEWYTVVTTEKLVTNTSSETATEYPGRPNEAVYSDGKWLLNEVYEYSWPVNLAVDAGTTLVITPVGNTAIDYVQFAQTKAELVGENYVVSLDNDANTEVVVCYKDVPVVGEDGVIVKVLIPSAGEAVSGQNANVFTGTSGTYFCKITNKDGVVYETRYITVDGYWFTQNPDKEDLAVQVNDPEKVESYQWYVYEDVEGTRTVVPENPADDEVEGWYADDIVYYDNKWYAVNGYVDYFAVEVKQGDQIIITPDASFSGDIFFRDRSSDYTVEEKDGSYIISILSDIEMLTFGLENDSREAFSFTAQVKGTKAIPKKVDGATAATLDINVTGEYFCVVTFKDGSVLMSNAAARTHKHIYTYTVKDGVITEACSCGHTATATLALDASVSLLYTGSEIKPATVACSENWVGGELTVVYANNVNAGNATASITVGGVTATITFTIVEPIPPTGDGMNVALVSCVAALALAAVLALGWDSKRKF